MLFLLLIPDYTILNYFEAKVDWLVRQKGLSLKNRLPVQIHIPGRLVQALF